MSLASAISGIYADRESIRLAIVAKGVAVPPGTTLAGMVPYIEAINAVVATAPAALTSGQWTATPITGGIAFNVTALPSDGGSAITALQYRIGTGAPVTLAGVGTGVRNVTGLAASAQDFQLRFVNAVDANPSNWSDIKNRTPLATGGGGGTPGELTYGSNTDDDAPMTVGYFSQYGSFFQSLYMDYVSIDTPPPATKPTSDWTVALLSPNLAGSLPVGATITSVSIDAVTNDRWQSPSLNVHECLRNVVVGGGNPSLANYATDLPWQGQSGSGAEDKSASLSSALVPAPGNAFTIPSSPALVAALQNWANGTRATPFWMYLSTSGAADDSCRIVGPGGSTVDGTRVRVRVGFTA